ncbi:MAG: DNA cytosine methyltransferase [Akkermansia sp.]|nr:DNA cytosine methyltransferase [Akkermansia sp.]
MPEFTPTATIPADYSTLTATRTPYQANFQQLLKEAAQITAKAKCAQTGYKSIELFAGAGGLALGLEQAGFDHIGLVEFNKAAAETLKKNRPGWYVLCEDVAAVAERNLEEEFDIKSGELDLLSGGAPCQSFSYAGKRLGLNDVRGTMFYYYAIFLRKLQPKFFLFENVRGLLSHDKGRTFQTILDIFKQEGYNTQFKVLNAWDYGVPQKRERLITIGIRNDLVEQAEFEYPIPHTIKPVIRDIKLDTNPGESECARYSKSKTEVFSLVPPGGYWRDIDPAIAKAYMKTCWDMEGGRTGILRRISLDEPSLTVLTNPGMKQTDRCHPLEVRPFSYRENARIQTFPDEWEFCGTLSEKYKQVGNAVPVNLAKEIGIKLAQAISSLCGH